MPPGAGIAENVFNSEYRTVRTADDLLTGANALAGQFDPGTRSGLRALAFALKAESLGEALQSYQQIPINTFGVTAPTYAARVDALALVRALLDSAETEIATTPPSAFFNANILTPGVSLPNVIHLFRARYARMGGDDATAIAASNQVARSGTVAMSVLTFPAPTVNFYANVTGGTNGIAPRRQWRTSMTGGDQRFTWFVVPLCESAKPASGLFPGRGAADQGRSASKHQPAGAVSGCSRFCTDRLHRQSRDRRSQGVSGAAGRRAHTGTADHRDL